MNKHRVLVDLKIAMNNGYCGIAKENRLVFKMLAKAPSIVLTGLLAAKEINNIFVKYKKNNSHLEAIAQTNLFFHEALNHDALLKNKILRQIKLARLFLRKKNDFSLYDIDPVFRDVIWRNVFDKSLSHHDRELILQERFAYSDITNKHESVSAYFKKNIMLDTSAYDFALFLEPTPINVAANTIKIVRYHDAIAITEPDFSGSLYSYKTINNLKTCAKNAYFICNSEPTREALLALVPEIAAKVFVIPIALSSNYQRVCDDHQLKNILLTRMSTQIVSPERLQFARQQITNMTNCHFIFNLAAFDPKKNHVQLIRAWEKLNYQYGGELKLVMAANRGWFSQEVENLMRPHIEFGNIIHLENVATDEMPYLFSHAKAFVFPSYTEGFGLPPLEAMQCACPVIVSKIPAHTWVCGDAALYCDPYDSDSLVAALEKVLYLPGAEALQNTLAERGLKQVSKYAEETLRVEWEQLFTAIKAQHARP